MHSHNDTGALTKQGAVLHTEWRSATQKRVPDWLKDAGSKPGVLVTKPVQGTGVTLPMKQGGGTEKRACASHDAGTERWGAM